MIGQVIQQVLGNLSKAHEMRDSLSSSCSQVVLIYLYPFRRNSLLKSTPQPQIAKNTKNPILEVQCHLRSAMFTPIKSLSLLLHEPVAVK